MSYLTVSQADRQRAPFRVERFLREEKPGRFAPAARLVVTPHLQESDLLRGGGAALTDEAARTLLAVLAAVLPGGGSPRPTTFQIASLLGLSEQAARDRLHRMADVTWRGEPLLSLHAAESGLEGVIPSPLLVDVAEGEPDADPPAGAGAGRCATSVPVGAGVPSVRERVIAHSRERYARPREEVERDVLRQLGHYPEETAEGPVGDAWRRLATLGVTNGAIHDLLEAYPLEAVVNQLDWLPLRTDVRNPARFVVAAIEGWYDPPARARLEAALEGDAGAREPSPLTPPQEPAQEPAAGEEPPVDAIPPETTYPWGDEDLEFRGIPIGDPEALSGEEEIGTGRDVSAADASGG